MSATSKRRVKKLFGSLSATERAVHIIRSWKEGRDEEREVRSSTPSEQARELNKLLATARSINREFAFVIMMAEQAAEKHRLRYAWLQSLRAWSLCADSDSMRRELVLAVPEYITEEERERRVAELGGEEWTLDEAAQHLSDVDESEDAKGWKAVLAAAVTDGSLGATGKGRSLRVRYGDLCSWRGEEVPVIPEWGLEAETHPDAGTVAMRRRAIGAVRAMLGTAPTVVLPGANIAEELPEDAGMADRTAFALVDLLRQEVPGLWEEVQALEQVIEEVRSRLDGEDPADPELRTSLDNALQMLVEVSEGLAEDGLGVELGEPSEEQVAAYRDILDRFVKLETGW